MKKLLARMGVLTVVFLSLIAVTNLAEAGEKKKFTYVKNARQMFAETKIKPEGGPAGRELAQMMYVDSVATASGWDFLEERGINQDDQIEGSGKHKGVAVNVMKNGDTVFQVYTGTHKTTVKEGGAWELNYQGTMEFKGGTGKYKDAKGRARTKARSPQTVLWKRAKESWSYKRNAFCTGPDELRKPNLPCRLNKNGLRQPQKLALQEGIEEEESCAKHSLFL